MADPYPDADLLRRTADGDSAAWDSLVARYTGLLWGVARGHGLGHAEAGDAVQTTWLRLLENVTRIREPERLAGWLATTARRECLRTIQQRRRVTYLDTIETFEVPDERAEPVDAPLLRAERDAQIWEALGQLPDQCQQLLRMLVASPELSYEQIAAALDRPIGAIGPTRGRCLRRLRTLLEERGTIDLNVSCQEQSGARS